MDAEMPSEGMLGSIKKKIMGTRFVPTAVETLRMPVTAQQARGLRWAFPGQAQTAAASS